jgi:cytochrome c-type biogenesis protein CcmH
MGAILRHCERATFASWRLSLSEAIQKATNRDWIASSQALLAMTLKCLSLVLVCAMFASPVHAVQPDEIMPNPAQESRARDLSRELRCMVCQNQSIDDSEAPLARDLRLLVRDRIGAGDSDKQVLDYLVARYGEFVLLKPRFEWHTLLLWLLTPLLLISGGVALWWQQRRRSANVDGDMVERLSAEDEARVQRLLDETLGDAKTP